MPANLTTKLGQLVDVLTPDTTNTRIGVANASPTRTLDVTGTGAISTSLALGGATIGTNALAVTGTTALSGLLTAAGGVSSTLTTDATSATTGSIITAGGISTQKALFVGTTSRLVGNAKFDGLVGIGMTPSNVLDITQTQDAASTISITNASTGASARSQVQLGGAVNLFTSSSGYSPSAPYNASQFVIQSYATNGLLFIAQNSGAPIIFGINAAEAGRFDTSGNLLMGTTGLTGGLNGKVINLFGSSTVRNIIQTTGQFAVVNLGSGGTSVSPATTAFLLTDGTANTASVGTGTSTPLQFLVNNTEKMRLDTTGSLLVGTTSSWTGCAAEFRAAGNALSAYNTASAGTAFVSRVNNTGAKLATWNYNGSDVGTVTTDGTNTAYNTSSDARLKTNVSDAAPASALIDAIQVRQFDWKSDDSHQRYGMVAQELIEIAPEAVSVPTDPEQMMGVDYSKLVPMLIKEVQSLRTRLAALENK